MGETNDNINKILKLVAKEEQYEECEISIQAISSGGANYSSYLYIATLTDTKQQGKKDLKLFIKVAALGEKLRDIAPYKIFEIESFFYNKLRKIYENIEEEHMVPAEYRFVAPKFYASNDECYKEVLVLEDMTSRGYQAFDRFKTIDWNYACKSVTHLAKFHALSIAWSVEDPEEFKKTEGLKCNNKLDKMNDNIKNIIFNALEAVRPNNKERVARFLSEATKENKFTNYYNPIRRPVLAHGDYRPNNLLHKIHDNGEIDIISVDYQTLQMSNPIIDLLYFIYIGSDKSFRKNHIKQLIERYYTELCAALLRLNLNPDEMYPREDFNYELKQIQPFGLVISMFCLLVVTVQDNDAPDVNVDIELDDFAVKPSELYRERINDIIDDYIDMGLL